MVPDGDTTTGGGEDFVDDYAAPPYDSHDSSYDEDLAWYDSEGDTSGEAYGSEADWCDMPDDLVCDDGDYVE